MAYSCTTSSCISIQHFSPEDVSGPRDAPTQASASGDVRVDREEEEEEEDKVPPETLHALGQSHSHLALARVVVPGVCMCN